jgi:hypothetical protein
MFIIFSERSLASNGKSQTLPNNFRAPKRLMSTRRTKQKGYWSDFLKGVFEK